MSLKILSICQDLASETKLYVVQWLYQETIDSQFIVYPRNWWLLWNYFRRVGIQALVTKVISRLAEYERNKKVFGIGIGLILDPARCTGKCIGKPVLFFAPNHNPDSKFLIVDNNFLIEISNVMNSNFEVICELPQSLKRMEAWSRFSGLPADFLGIQSCLKELAKNIPAVSAYTLINVHEVVDHIEVSVPKQLKPSAVLFGLGNYAKTAILPNIRNNLQLQRVHEIDPDQLLYLKNNNLLSLDTSSLPRHGLFFDAWFIAGYHHTHADLASKALLQGATAVIEKPLVTNRQQYNSFLSVLKQCPHHRFYLCFHKRYSKLHSLFISDLGVHKGEPIDMHCLVYEIPLPRHHWYNWPNSGSRLISNGCHWIDYFMFVNNYCEVSHYRKWMPRGSDLVVQMKLANGAYFSMTLTDSGSQRLGVREFIELRVKDCTFSIIDGERYVAENRKNVFRRARVNPLDAYAKMYQKISKNIVQGVPGDSVKSLRSTEATLTLEELT